jgi:putative ABC transport system substrate-binding protein
VQGLQEAGWLVGRNVQVETRWSTGDLARLSKDAAQLVATAALVQATHTIPIVFAQGIDQVGAGYIDSVACFCVRRDDREGVRQSSRR